MNRTRRWLATTAAAVAVALASAVPQTAEAIACGNCAQEVTQLLNNLELIGIAAKEAEAVSEAIERRIIQANQYATMLKNLQKLPQAAIDQVLAPYQQQVATLTGLGQTINGLKSSADSVRNIFNQRLNEASSLNMNLADYMRHEAALATQRGGIYRQRLQQDNAAVDELKVRAEAVRAAAMQNKDITGNIEGLQVLAQHASLAAGELVEIKASLLATSSDRNAESALREEARAVKSTILGRTLDEAKTQKNGRQGQQMQSGSPWNRSWQGMQPAP